MPNDSPVPSSRELCLDIRAARARLEQYINQLARAKKLIIAVQLEPGSAEVTVPAIHTVTLRIQNDQTMVCIDHDSFIEDDEFFGDFVIPEINAAIDKLIANR